MALSRQHRYLFAFSGLFSLLILVGCNDPSPSGEGGAADKKTSEKSEATSSEKSNSGSNQTVESKKPVKEEPAKSDQKISLKIVTPEQYQKEIEKYKGKVVLVDFWATWCVNCIKEMKHHVELAKELEKDGFVIIMMCMDENSEEVQKRASGILVKRKCFFPSLMAKDGSEDQAYQDYKIEGDALPHYKLYDRKGKLIHAFVSTEESPIERDDVKKRIVEALKK